VLFRYGDAVVWGDECLHARSEPWFGLDEVRYTDIHYSIPSRTMVPFLVYYES
jgi:hypothetical protein